MLGRRSEKLGDEVLYHLQLHLCLGCRSQLIKQLTENHERYLIYNH